MERFLSLHNLGMTAVFYKGVGDMYQDLFASNIQAAFMPLADALQHARAGRIKVLGASSPARRDLPPDVDTLPGEHDNSPFRYQRPVVMYAPPGTDRRVKETMQAALRGVLGDKGVAEAFARVGVAINPSAEGTPGAEPCTSGYRRCDCVGCVKTSDECPKKTC